MTKLEQAARQALGALEVATTPMAKDRQEVLRAITTLREALSGAQALSAAPEAIANLRHLYQNMVNGAVRDTASAKRIAEGLLAPAIEALERATPPAEQQAQPGAVYAELHEPDATTVGLGAVWNRHSMRDFADRTHALRQAVIAPELQAEARRRYDAAMEQAAPKAAPEGPSDAEIDDFLDSPAGITWVIAANRERYRRFVRAALAKWAAPQQEAQEPVAWLSPWRADQVTTDYDAYGERGIPLYTAPQPAPAPLSDDTERLEWLLWKLPGDALRYVVGELADTSSGAEFRAAIDAALAAHGGKV